MKPNDNQNSNNFQLIQRSQISDGLLLPRMLAATPKIAAGDIYYTNAQGIFTRLPAGSNGQYLRVSSGVPSWFTQAGYSGTIALAKLTSGGAAGSIVVVNGLVTSVVQAT